MKTAVIDIGSNSVRLLLANIQDTRFTFRRKYLTTTRLAEGLMTSGLLSAQAMSRTLAAVDAYRKQALDWGVDTVHCYATSAVREAANGRDFVLSLRGLDGLCPEVIAGGQEAEIAYLGANTGGLPVLDVGGASTELISMQDSKLRACSVRMGCVVCKEMFIHTDPISAADAKALDDFCQQKAAELALAAGNSNELAGVGGSATQLAMLKLGLDKYSPEEVDNCYLSVEDVAVLYSKLQALPLDDRKRMPGMAANRADIIPVGAAIILAVLAACGANGMYTSDGDGLEGYALLMQKINP